MIETKGMTTGRWLIAFACGAAAGAVAGIITAPRSGRETRQQLRGFAQRVSNKARRLPQAMSESVDRMAQAGKDTFTDSYPRTAPRTNT